MCWFCVLQGLLNRVRRQVQPGFGGFAFPQPVFNFPQFQPGQGGQGSFVQSSQTLSSRFGEDEPVVTGQTQTFHSSGGKFQSTHTVLRPDGSVQTNKQTGESWVMNLLLWYGTPFHILSYKIVC